MALRAAVRRLEGQRRNREGRRRTLLSTPVHARTGPDRSRGLVDTSRILELALFLASDGHTPTPFPNEFHEGSLTFLGETDRFVRVRAGFLIRAGLGGDSIPC